MPALRKPKHERVAQLLATCVDYEEASRAAGYPEGSSFRANARRRSLRPDIKARVAELQSADAALAIVDAAWIKRKAAEVAGVDLHPADIKASDKVSALNLLAKMTPGALVPTQTEMSGPGGLPVPVMSITRVIVEPRDQDRESLPASA